jgi:CRISPR-associated protein Cas8a1/Csx13
MRLHAPGMTVLHRAGLGGLAATLKYLERAAATEELTEEEFPGAPWPLDGPPWEVGEESVTLRFGDAEDAAAVFFDRLFRATFRIRDGLVYLPGQYGGLPPPLPVRAALQDGLLRTFYDHGPQSRGVGDRMSICFDVDDKQVAVEYPRIEWYSHQHGAALATASLSSPQPLTRMLYPGAIQRHVKHAASSITNLAPLLVPLLFAPVGCFALRAGGRRVKDKNRRVFKPGGVIIIPDFNNLPDARSILASLIPRDTRESRVVSPGDAALGAEIRLRAANLVHSPSLASIRAVWCCATDWNSRLQPPCWVCQIQQDALNDERLERYAVAVAVLRSQVYTNQGGENFLVDSVVRPLIANNLALDNEWYQDFTRLMTARDTNNRPLRDRIRSEQRGLHEMTTNPAFLSDAENVLVLAVHRAIRNNFGRIRQETDGNGPLSQGTINRWGRFRERLRLALVGAKTADQCRNALCVLFGNAGTIPELQDGWRVLLPLLSDRRWTLARDLALIALASYAGSGVKDDEPTPTSEGE